MRHDGCFAGVRFEVQFWLFVLEKADWSSIS